MNQTHARATLARHNVLLPEMHGHRMDRYIGESTSQVLSEVFEAASTVGSQRGASRLAREVHAELVRRAWHGDAVARQFVSGHPVQ